MENRIGLKLECRQALHYSWLEVFAALLLYVHLSNAAGEVQIGMGMTGQGYGRTFPAPDGSGRSEILLNGDDWKLGSFSMGEGERQQAYAVHFRERDFRSVPVPAEIQTTLGLKGMELYRFSKEISLLNKKEWWYRKSFTVPRAQAGKSVRLVFEGADYFSSVWLNGEKLGDHAGCYTRFAFDITSRIKPGRPNLLAVKVTCPWLPKDRSLGEYHKGSFALLWPNFTLAPLPQLPNALSFIWDGIPAKGNAVMTLGLIRDVKLEVTSRCWVEDLYAYTKSLNPDGSATLVVSGTVQNDGADEIRKTINLGLRPDNFSGQAVPIPPQPLRLRPGTNTFTIEVAVRDPKLWWSWELGAQNLYRLSAALEGPAAADTDRREVRVGIRTVERGADMGYRLNGKPIFIRGVWYPMGSYFSSQNTRALYAKDLLLLRNANANALVNHTVVEKREFYDLCDELGLLIEVQMPFSQSGPLWIEKTPRYAAYKESVLEHAKNIVLQLRNHPSIITWAPYAEFQSSGNAANELRAETAKIVNEYAPGATYHWSFCDGGERHIWNATTGGDYREDFDTNSIPIRFLSEYGCCAMPGYENLHKWFSPDEIWSDKNPRMPYWYDLPIDIQAHTYLSSFSYEGGLHSLLYWATQVIDGDVRSARELVEASQLYQAFKAQYYSEAFRRRKHDKVQGMRWWAYKDSAPGHRFGFLDHDQTPKIAYYYYKRTCAPLAVNFAYRDEMHPQPAGSALKIPVWVVSDLRSAIALDVQCEIVDLQGKPVWSRAFQAELGEDESKVVGAVEWTIPEARTVQIYLLRATAKERGGDRHCSSAKYVKVVPKGETALVAGVPGLEKQCRVLLIGNNKPADAIARHLRQLNAEVDVLDTDRLDRLAELRDAEALRRKYDVIWLTTFEAFWKALDDDMANGVVQAVRQGCGFVHTGGRSSFAGDPMVGSHLSLTPLADILPVKVRSGIDLCLPGCKEVRVLEYGWSDCGLKKAGVESFNETEPKGDGRIVMKAGDKPLLACGRYARGHTVAFMGFTPEAAPSPMWLGLYAQMLMAAQGENSEYRYAAAADINKPQMQLLKEQPVATVRLGSQAVNVAVKEQAGRFSLEVANGDRFARLMRIRAEWPDEVEKSIVMLYSDNYVDLLPREKATIDVEVRLLAKASRTIKGTLVLEGTNVAEQRIPIRVKAE